MDRAKFRVKVTIEAIEHEGAPQAILTVNGETARHRHIGYPPGTITFKHGTRLNIAAEPSKRLSFGYRMDVFSEHDPLNGPDPTAAYGVYHKLCEIGAGQTVCPRIPARPSTLALNSGGCHRVAAEIYGDGRRVSSAAVCLTPVR